MRFEVDAVLFDIDGTVVDSTAAVGRSWRAWSAARGIDAVEVLRVCHGRRPEDTVAEFLPSEQRAAAVAELERLELADLDDVIALPATRDLLSRLPSYRWAAVTSGSQLLMRARLAAAGLPVPDVLVAAEDVRLGKPDRRDIWTRPAGSASTLTGASSWKTHQPAWRRDAQRGRTCSGWPRPTRPTT